MANTYDKKERERMGKFLNNPKTKGITFEEYEKTKNNPVKSRTDRFLDSIRENTKQDNERLLKKAREANKKEAEEKKRKKRVGTAGGIKPSTQLEGKLPGKKKFRIGGHVKKKRIDGIAKKGKTRGTII